MKNWYISVRKKKKAPVFVCSFICCLDPVFMCSCLFMLSFQVTKTLCHCNHPPTRLQYSTVEGRQKEMWGDSPLFLGQKKTPIVSERPPLPRLASPCMPLEVQRKERKRFREREREGGKAGSLCSCSCRGLWITSEWQRRKEWEKRERGEGREGHPEKRGHPQEGVRHTPQIRPLFFHALYSFSLSVSLSRVVLAWPSTERSLLSEWGVRNIHRRLFFPSVTYCNWI